ncbi:MAG: 5-formyltetrahydrofolate cyclo-ligase [Candidatus Marinimicrobia bacterium]|nr:5-formyltetrahydrofolate cyclo-ligase [Candidatus Neomarinimicrobiota bacterium]
MQPPEQARERARIRASIAARRRQLDPAWVAAVGAALQGHALAWPPLAAARCVGLYLAQAHEAPTAEIAAGLAANKAVLCVPRWRAAARAYEWARWRPGAALRAGPAAIAEPARRAPPAVPPDVVFVPVVAVDRAGHRLGHGAGHYDRLLADSRAVHVALAFAFQVVPELPAAPWDVPMHWLVTEDGAAETTPSYEPQP